MKRTTLAAVFGNIVSLAAVALVHFGIELTAEQQAEIVSALLVIVNTVALIVPAVIATVNKRRDVQGSREGGFVTLSLLQGIALATIMGLILTACTVAPETPRQAIAASYVTIESLAETAEIAYRDGHIDTEKRDQLRGQLQDALDAAASAQQIVEAGGNAEHRIEAVRAILAGVQAILEQKVEADE